MSDLPFGTWHIGLLVLRDVRLRVKWTSCGLLQSRKTNRRHRSAAAVVVSPENCCHAKYPLNPPHKADIAAKLLTARRIASNIVKLQELLCKT
jgi:hypothetical protein